MGRCHEFGSQIREGCAHPMRAGERACACPDCGVICQGQFDGCPDVWALGPRPVSLTAPASGAPASIAPASGAPASLAPASGAPAIEAPRVRALASGLGGPAPGPATAPPTNGNGNGSAYAPPPPPPPPRSQGNDQASASRTEVLRWFEDAFDELRNELHAMASTVARQQAMLAELLDAREAELRVVMVAESLPELAGEAAAKALADQSDGLADQVVDTLDEVRAAMRAADQSSVAVMDGMRELLRRVEVTAEINAEDARVQGAARLEALKASVGRQLRPVNAAVTEIADYVAAAEEREAVRNRALKASITRQLQPLAAAVEAAVQHSDEQMSEIRARLDALGAPKVRATRATTPKAKPAATAKRAAPRRRAEPPAPAPEPEVAPPAPTLNRRRPATRPRGSGPLAGA